MKSYKFIFLVSFLLFELSSTAQLDSIVNYYANRYSESSHRFVEIPNEKGITITDDFRRDSLLWARYLNSDNYFYHLIDSIATEEELIKLTSHESPIVQFYSAYALGKRDTLILPDILKKMLDSPLSEGCTSTDVIINRPSASMIFTSLWRRKRETGLPSDIYMDKLDSIYLLHPNTPYLEKGMRLTRLRSDILKPTIETLAFEQRNMSAIRYMNKWYKGEYYKELNKVYLEALDSNIVEFSMPVTKEIIKNLIELNEKKTLRELGGWLKHNRTKWVGLKGIDEILDKSWEIKDSIKWGQERYPYISEDLEFILGNWVVISGWTIQGYKELRDEKIVFERPKKNNSEYLKINVDQGGSSAITFWGERNKEGNRAMISCPVVDVTNKRISFGSLEWNWYDIVIADDKLILTKE